MVQRGEKQIKVFEVVPAETWCYHHLGKEAFCCHCSSRVSHLDIKTFLKNLVNPSDVQIVLHSLPDSALILVSCALPVPSGIILAGHPSSTALQPRAILGAQTCNISLFGIPQSDIFQS